MQPRPVELLAPAKNADCGIEAIRHGADAVYIGAPRFGARAAAGNSIRREFGPDGGQALHEHAPHDPENDCQGCDTGSDEKRHQQAHNP